MVRRINEARESNRKYNEVYVLQGYYNGWEDLEEVPANDPQQVAELKDDLRAYRENERTSFRIITRKVPNPDYDPSKARKNREHGIMVVTKDDEVWFTDDESLNREFLKDNGYIYDDSVFFWKTLYKDGYEFVKNNFDLLDKSEYEHKKRYSYYTYYLNDGSRPKDIIYVEKSTRY